MTILITSNAEYNCMFVRVRKQIVKNVSYQYAYLVTNQWNPYHKKHEQKILMSLGRVSDLPSDGTIEKTITALDKFALKMGYASLTNGVILSDLTDETILSKTYEYGPVLLTRHLLEKLSLTKILTKAYENSKKEHAAKTIASDKKKQGKRKQPFISLTKFLTAVCALLSYRFYPKTQGSDLDTFYWYESEVFFGSRKKREELSIKEEQIKPVGKQDKKETSGTTLIKDDIYRSLDILLENKDFIESSYYEQNKDLFTQGLDLVLFDTTTLYYYGAEGAAEKEDLLQYNAANKDGKNDEKQIVVGVLMTKDGVPIAHEVLPGNTADVNSMARIMDIIKSKYHLLRVLLIADRGMISEKNLLLLDQMGYSYLLGVRMRKLPPVLQKKLLEPIDPADETAGMEPLYPRQRPDSKLKPVLFTKTGTLNDFSDEELNELLIKNIIKRKITELAKPKILEFLRKRRYFICYNPDVSSETKKKRGQLKETINQKILTDSTKDWIAQNKYKKYLDFPDGIRPVLNEQKLTNEELFDGKWMLLTNDQTITAKDAIPYYKTLAFVEQGFRDLKSLITVRPIYHWKEERIRGHIFVCFLSLIMKWYVCRVLDIDSQQAGRRFIEEMINLKAVAVSEANPLFVRTAIQPSVQEQMKKLGMQIPGKIVLDGRKKAAVVNPKGGRPRNVTPGQYSIAFLENPEQKT